MFEHVEVLIDDKIRSFKFYGYTSGTVEVWTWLGMHVGFTFLDSGWTKVAEHSFMTSTFQLVEIPNSIFTEMSIDANTHRAFYVTLQGGQYQLYNHGQESTEAMNAEDDNVKIYEGPAKQYLFGGQTGPRVWQVTSV